jgi:predicted patatin/cPLA2 family phospholipase
MSIVLDLPACGMRGIYYWGIYLELRSNQLVIDRIYGRSSGAIVGACILCIPESFDDLYIRVIEYSKTMYITDSFCKALSEVLPDDAFLTCTNRLFVTSAVMGFIPCTTSVFRDNEHLLETLYASGSIPFVTSGHRIARSGFWPTFDGLFIDMFYGNKPCRNQEAYKDMPHILSVAVPASCCWPGWIPITCHAMSVAHATIALGRSSTHDCIRKPDQKVAQWVYGTQSPEDSPYGWL